MKNKLFRKLLSVALVLTVAAGTTCIGAMTAGAQTVEEVTVSAANQKLVNTSVISAEEITLGGTVTVTASAAGGQGSYTYSVLYKKHNLSKWTVKQDYSTNRKVKIKPGTAADYDVCVKVKDSRGVIAKRYFTIKVNQQLTNYTRVSSTKIDSGSSVRVNAYGIGGTGAYKYAVYYRHTSSSKWTTVSNYSDESVFFITPSKNEDFEICVKIKDESGAIAKKYIMISVVDYAKEVYRIVNEERAKEGVSPLELNETLCKAAAKRAEEISSVFSHYRPDGTVCFTAIDEYGIFYWGAGENIAAGQATPESAMNAWMNSQGHRENILESSFTDIGIGFYKKNGTYYWVQLFILAA